jgi:hypothetical protein
MSTGVKNPVNGSRASWVAALTNALCGRPLDERAAGKESV